MLLLRTVLGALIIGVASSLRNCDSCTEINECRQAVELLITNKTVATATLLQNAFCGRQGRNVKICCSDFSFNSDDVEGESEDEIENHPNLHLLPEECGPIEGFRIFGGTRPSLYELPWIVLISHNIKGVLKFNCGGSVINDRYVLTAAHCIKGHKIAGVRIGEYDMDKKVDCYGVGQDRMCESKLQDIRVDQAIIHAEYSRFPTTVNDIGLLRLKERVDFSYKNAAAICLPVFKDLREMDLSTEKGTVAGWGRTEYKNQSPVLLKVSVPIYSAENCKSFYDRNRKSNMSNYRFGSTLCAGDLGQDSCSGDSGGPLMLESSYNESYRMVQFGVVSYGPANCGSNTPGVYTDLRKFMKWILDNIKP